MQINWSYSNKRILTGVRKWLEKCDRPKPTKVQGLAPERTLRANLKALGAYRLIKYFGSVNEAISYVKNTKKRLVYFNSNKWHEAKKEVETQIQELNFQSGFWHPDIKLLPKKYFRTTPYWDVYSKAYKKGN